MALTDLVKPLKYESTILGNDLDLLPTEMDPTQDSLLTKGIAIENGNTSIIKNSSGEIEFADSVNGSYTKTTIEDDMTALTIALG
jgi:hypothetical protein